MGVCGHLLQSTARGQKITRPLAPDLPAATSTPMPDQGAIAVPKERKGGERQCQASKLIGLGPSQGLSTPDRPRGTRRALRSHGGTIQPEPLRSPSESCFFSAPGGRLRASMGTEARAEGPPTALAPLRCDPYT